MTATLAPSPVTRRSAVLDETDAPRRPAERASRAGGRGSTASVTRTRERVVRPLGGDIARPADRRPPSRRRPVVESQRTAVGTRCASPAQPATVYRRRRTAALGILVGVGLAVMVWVIGIVGTNYAESVTPSPVGTEVVHVRQGESLSAIATRVAPDLPRQTVIDEIVALNDMDSSGLRAGQPLLTPDYR
jgi:hypothetical protein